MAWMSSERAKHIDKIAAQQAQLGRSMIFFNKLLEQCTIIEEEVIRLRQDRKTVSR